MMRMILFGAGCLALVMSGGCLAHREDHSGDHSRTAARAHDHDHHAHNESEQQAGEKPRLGAEVKDFVITNSTGAAFRLGTLRRADKSNGKIAVLTFWCTTCASCRVIERDFDRKAREYQIRGVSFFMLDSNSTDDAVRVNRFLRNNGLSFPVLMDSESEIARYFGATVTTTTAVIDAEGRLRYYGGFGRAEDAIRNLLAGTDVIVAETRPTG